MIFTSFAASFEMYAFCAVVTIHVPSVCVSLFPCLHIMFNSPSAWYCLFLCLHITVYWHVCTSLFIGMSAPQFNSLSLHQLIIIPCLHVAVYFSQHISLFPCLHVAVYFSQYSLFPCLHFTIYFSQHISLFPCLQFTIYFSQHISLFPCLHFTIYFHLHLAVYPPAPPSACPCLFPFPPVCWPACLSLAAHHFISHHCICISIAEVWLVYTEFRSCVKVEVAILGFPS